MKRIGTQILRLLVMIFAATFGSLTIVPPMLLVDKIMDGESNARKHYADWFAFIGEMWSGEAFRL